MKSEDSVWGGGAGGGGLLAVLLACLPRPECLQSQHAICVPCLCAVCTMLAPRCACSQGCLLHAVPVLTEVHCWLSPLCVLLSPPVVSCLVAFPFSLQLKRLVRYLRRQQALGRALPEGITPVVLAAPPAQQGMPPRTRM